MINLFSFYFFYNLLIIRNSNTFLDIEFSNEYVSLKNMYLLGKEYCDKCFEADDETENQEKNHNHAINFNLSEEHKLLKKNVAFKAGTKNSKNWLYDNFWENNDNLKQKYLHFINNHYLKSVKELKENKVMFDACNKIGKYSNHISYITNDTDIKCAHMVYNFAQLLNYKKKFNMIEKESLKKTFYIYGFSCSLDFKWTFYCAYKYSHKDDVKSAEKYILCWNLEDVKDINYFLNNEFKVKEINIDVDDYKIIRKYFRYDPRIESGNHVINFYKSNTILPFFLNFELSVVLFFIISMILIKIFY